MINKNDGRGSGLPAQIAGLAPSADDVRRVRRRQWIALAIYGTPLMLLMIGMYVRLEDSVGRLQLGWIFTYFFPLIVVAVLAALLWALVVEPFSRGNSLGDHVRSQERVDVETERFDAEILDRGRHAALDARRYAETGRTALVTADGQIAEMAEIGHRALQIAHASLGVRIVGRVRPENLTAQGFPHRDRIEQRIEVERARTAHAAAALEECALPALACMDSPHAVYTTPPGVVPDLAFVVPTTMAPYAGSTLGLTNGQDAIEVEDQPARNRRAIVGAAVVVGLLLVVTAIVFFFVNQNSALAGRGATGTGASVRVNVDGDGTTDDLLPNVPARG